MRGSLFCRALLAAAVGVGAWAGSARADAPLPPVPAPTPAQGQPVVISGTSYGNPTAPPTTVAPAPCATCGTSDGAAERRGLGLPHPLRDWWSNHERCGCWAH